MNRNYWKFVQMLMLFSLCFATYEWWDSKAQDRQFKASLTYIEDARKA